MTVFHRRGRRGSQRFAERRHGTSRAVFKPGEAPADYRAARLVPCLLCGPLRSSASSAVLKAVTADLGSETHPLPESDVHCWRRVSIAPRRSRRARGGAATFGETLADPPVAERDSADARADRQS